MQHDREPDRLRATCGRRLPRERWQRGPCETASRPPPVRCRRWWCGASPDARSGSCGVTACTVQRLSHISTSCGSQTWRYMYCGWAANSDSSSISRMRCLLVEALDRVVVDRADVERLAAAHRMAAHHRMPHRRHRRLLRLGRRRRAGDPVQHAEIVPRLAALDLAAQASGRSSYTLYMLMNWVMPPVRLISMPCSSEPTLGIGR